MTSGDLARTAAADVLEDLSSRAQSGLLVLRRGQVACHLCLKDGRLVFATSNLKRFQPTSWVVARKLATSAAARAAEQATGQGGTQGFVDALVRDGGVDRASLVASIRDLVRAVALDGLAWTEGTYQFTSGLPVLDSEVLLTEPTRSLVEASRGPAPAAPQEGEGAPGDAGAGPEGAAPAEAREAVSPEVQTFRDHVRQAEDLDFYTLLGVARDADEDTVRQSYYKMARQYHPDAMRGEVGKICRDEAEQYFAMVTEAYNTLTRKTQRDEYDAHLKVGQRGGESSDPQDPATLARQNFDQGRRSMAAGELYDASQFFSNAVRLDPERGEYHRELGIVQMQNPRWQKQAEESLRQAIELQPADIRALVHLGKLYAGNGLKTRARDAFQKVLRWDADCDEAREGLESLESDEEAGDGGLLKGLFTRR